MCVSHSCRGLQLLLSRAGAVELRTGLAAEFRLELPATVTFDYPTVAALTAFIAAQMAEAADIYGGGALSAASSRSARCLAYVSSICHACLVNSDADLGCQTMTS